MNIPIRFVLCGLLAALIGAPGAARGAEIVVTMKDDVVANDGKCSLREAIGAANTNTRSGSKQGECIAGERAPVVDVIRLRCGTYRSKRRGAGEDQNQTGDFDITESVIIQGKGMKGTVIQNSIGDPTVPGDGDRLFHIDPGAVGGVDVTLSKVTLARGDVTCSGANCDPGGSTVDQRGSGSLTLDKCIVMRSWSSCQGEGCGSSVSGAPITVTGGGHVTIRGTTLKKNKTQCAFPGCSAGPAAISVIPGGGIELLATAGADLEPSFTLEDSEIVQSSATCAGDGCRAAGVVQVGANEIALRGVSVADNETSCEGPDCGVGDTLVAYADTLVAYAGASLVAEQIQVARNAARCTGDRCYVGSELYLGGATASLQGADLHESIASCRGASCYLGYRHLLYGARADADGIESRSHTVGCQGQQCQVQPMLTVYGDGQTDVVDVELGESAIFCNGNDCEVGSLAWWYGVPLRTLRTEIDGNASSCDGESCRLRNLVDVDATGDSKIDGQTIGSNVVECVGTKCSIAPMVEIEVREGDLTLIEPVTEANQQRCEGVRCATSSLLTVVADALTADELQLSGNQVRCTGLLCEIGSVAILDVYTNLHLDRADVSSNSTWCNGAGCRGQAVMRLAGDRGTIDGSSITHNQARCDGEDCATGTGGALRNHMTRLTISDSQITSNGTDGFGAAVFNDAGRELVLDHVGLYQNEAGLRGVMEFGGFGGAIYNDAANGVRGNLKLDGTDIRANRSLRQGGGVANEGVVSLANGSVVADNTLGNCVDMTGGTGCPP